MSKLTWYRFVNRCHSVIYRTLSKWFDHVDLPCDGETFIDTPQDSKYANIVSIMVTTQRRSFTIYKNDTVHIFVNLIVVEIKTIKLAREVEHYSTCIYFAKVKAMRELLAYHLPWLNPDNNAAETSKLKDSSYEHIQTPHEKNQR